MREYAAAPIHTSVIAMRHGGHRYATWVPLSILTANLTNLTMFLESVRPGPSWAYLVAALFSSQTVPRFNSAHVTRTK